MESQKPKVAMYVKRSFGEKLNASFDFIKENWKLLLKFITYLLLPVSLIQALSLNGLMGGALKISAVANTTAMAASPSSLVGFMSYYGLYMLVFMIGTILLTSLIYAMIRTYNEREERLEGITLGSLKPLLFHNIKKLLILTLFGILLVLIVGVVIGVLAALSLFTLFLTIPVIIAFTVPLALWAPIYLFEDKYRDGGFQKNIPTRVCHMGRHLSDLFNYGNHSQCIAERYHDAVVYRYAGEIFLLYE